MPIGGWDSNLRNATPGRSRTGDGEPLEGTLKVKAEPGPNRGILARGGVIRRKTFPSLSHLTRGRQTSWRHTGRSLVDCDWHWHWHGHWHWHWHGPRPRPITLEPAQYSAFCAIFLRHILRHIHTPRHTLLLAYLLLLACFGWLTSCSGAMAEQHRIVRASPASNHVPKHRSARILFAPQIVMVQHRFGPFSTSAA